MPSVTAPPIHAKRCPSTVERRRPWMISSAAVSTRSTPMRGSPPVAESGAASASPTSSKARSPSPLRQRAGWGCSGAVWMDTASPQASGVAARASRGVVRMRPATSGGARGYIGQPSSFPKAHPMIFRVVILLAVVTLVTLLLPAPAEDTDTRPVRHMEALGRGVVAIHQGEGKVFVGWRLLGVDPDDVAFNLYRASGDGEPVKLNTEPIAKATHYQDSAVDLSKGVAYTVRPVVKGKELAPSAAFKLPPDAPARPYLSIPLKTLPGHTPNDAAVGDLDGDGEYEIVIKQEMRPRDNSKRGATGETKLEAYRLDGTFLWRINLGKNIREGAHYTQFLVYDLDGDGKAEVVCKTADGTVDGIGKVIGDPKADHRNAEGYVLDGPEFLTVFDGRTGRALA